MRDPNNDVDIADTVDALLKAFAGTSAMVKRTLDPKFVKQSIVMRCVNCNDKSADLRAVAPAHYAHVFASQSNSLATTTNVLERSLQDGAEEPHPVKMWCIGCNELTDQKLVFHIKSKTAPCMIVVVSRRDKDVPNFDATKLQAAQEFGHYRLDIFRSEVALERTRSVRVCDGQRTKAPSRRHLDSFGCQGQSPTSRGTASTAARARRTTTT